MIELIARLLARPRLTEGQRAYEFNRLSEDDCGLLVAFFAEQYPANFDVALAALHSYGLEEVTR
jgi:hypothetical protein